MYKCTEAVQMYSVTILNEKAVARSILFASQNVRKEVALIFPFYDLLLSKLLGARNYPLPSSQIIWL